MVNIFSKKEYVTVVTSAIYCLLEEMEKNNPVDEDDEDNKMTVKYFLDNVIFVKNSNRSRYAKMLGCIMIRDVDYNFIHPGRQGVRSRKIHKYEKERQHQIETNKLFRYFENIKEEKKNGTTVSE